MVTDHPSASGILVNNQGLGPIRVRRVAPVGVREPSRRVWEDGYKQ